MTKESYGEAYSTGYVRTVRFLNGRGLPSDTAQEVAQSAWARGWEKIGQLRNEGMVLTWVNTIALNCHRRTRRRYAQLVPLKDVECAADGRLAAIDVELILEKCGPEKRRLFQKYLAGETVRDIAFEEQVSITAIRLRFLRARKEILRMLKVEVANRPPAEIASASNNSPHFA